MATWKELIIIEMKGNGDSWDDIVDFCLAGSDWNKGAAIDLTADFDDGFGGENGCCFQLWTEKFVYFPLCYDGSEWCGSASRNPNGKALRHQGG